MSTVSHSSPGKSGASIDCLLFDLDGTLIDTAQDMVRVLDQLCVEESVPSVPFEEARNRISLGVKAMLSVAMPDRSDEEYAALRQRFLDLYEQRLAVDSRLFEGFERVLSDLDDLGLPWGVVTNKPAAYTEPLMAHLQLSHRAACIVSGDTANRPKPAPDPLLLACDRIGIRPQQCLFAGDAELDVQAGRAAGMYTVAVTYGYILPHDDVHRWQADAMIDHPEDLRRWLPEA